MSEPHSTPAAHKAAAPTCTRVYWITVSDTRTEDTDAGGRLARDLITAAGHEIAGYRILRDEPTEVAGLIEEVSRSRLAECVITSGGTGVTARDSTYEAVVEILDKRLDGFGELFRMLSYQAIGSAAMLSRAVGGVHRRLLVFTLPGSPAAVRLGLEKLILPELGHLVGELRR